MMRTMKNNTNSYKAGPSPSAVTAVAIKPTTAVTKVDKQQLQQQQENEDLYVTPPEQHFLSTPPHGDTTAVHIYNNNTTDVETVVILHGCGGYKQDWQTGKIAPRLATHYRVVLFDWYGHGESSDLAMSADDDDDNNNKNDADKDDEYTTKVYLQQLEAVLQEYCNPQVVPKFHLYAFSMGNYLALHYLRLHPQRIRRLVLHSPWNAEMAAFGPARIMKFFMSLPAVGLRAADVLRKASFAHVHSAAIFRNILTRLGQGTAAWDGLLDDVAATLQQEEEGHDPSPQDGQRRPVGPEKILILYGQAEKPFGRVARHIYHKLQASAVPIEMYSQPHASHMTWHDQANEPTGAWWRNHIFDFLTQA